MEGKIVSGIQDNHNRGKIGDFLKEKIKPKIMVCLSFFTKDSLHKAVKAIAGTFKRRNVANLLTDCGGRLVDAQRQIRDTSDFELIKWLVII